MVSRRLPLVIVASVCGFALALGACTSSGASDRASSEDGADVQTLSRADVDTALDEWTQYAADLFEAQGVPGVGYAVVFEDKVVSAGGFGVRDIDRAEPVDADTVFQIASVSKPLGSTVVAALVGRDVIDWDDPIVQYNPEFALSDPWVTDHVTFADLYAHRSGLGEHVGDGLEDLGFTREQILERLRYEPLQPFRTTYAYTNFGMTEAGVTAAAAAGMSWEEASQTLLYEPLGMDHTSSTFADYIAEENRAVPHMRIDGQWVTGSQRQPDAQSPAGGASSSANDMAEWMRLQLAGGEYDGEEIVDPDALLATHTGHVTQGPPNGPGALAPMYGLGWNVSADTTGALRLSHSGAFLLGAGTVVELSPAAELGIVILSNGTPIGAVEAAAKTFMDLALMGESSRDWFSLYEPVFVEMLSPTVETDYAVPPPGATDPAPLSTYVGVYTNQVYGPLAVQESAAGLTITVGPRADTFPLTHFDGDVFAFVPPGENTGPPAPVTFTLDNGVATEVVVAAFDENGLGTFIRS